VPIHDLGYQTWEGRLVPEAGRWWVITQTGIRLAWRSRWLRRMLLLAWLPAVYLGALFFAYEQVLAHPELGRAAGHMLYGLPQYEKFVPTASMADPSQSRPLVWAWLLWIFFRYPQGMLIVLLVGLIAPPLIAQDVRSRAFLLYFSRPLTRMEYIFGKLAVVWSYVLLITTVPALVLYVLGVLLSPELNVVIHTWDLPLRIVAASMVLIIPTTTLALALSSLTSESRYAGFGWFAVWAVGWVTHSMLYTSTLGTVERKWTLVSLYHTLAEVQSWVFGIGPSFAEILPWAMTLVAISVVSLVVLFHRVSAPMRM